MSRLQSAIVYPIKSLDGTTVERATVAEGGGLAWDRRYAVVDDAGEYVNGKRERAIHRIDAAYDLVAETVTVTAPDAPTKTFGLEDERDELAAWLSAFLGYPVSIRRNEAGGFPDDTDAAGPTVIGAETLRAVATWYDEIDATEMRRRLRPNLVVGGVDPFWEDRLYDRPGRVVPFTVGEVEFRGVNPCQRCVVPIREPDTGAETTGFRERFVERREETLPPWATREQFDHFFRLMVNTRVPRASWGRELAVGDVVAIEPPIAEEVE
ncbi:MOSC N-terminal beta barrel domain-containing protein [Halobacteria archaeon AArc-dxtr1]|nr:MOSC N-terminal beta barrel domain-containing protein [Halobacteria archaeon AArc-dxtr1]